MTQDAVDRKNGAALTPAQVDILIYTWRQICVEEHLEGVFALLVDSARRLTDAEHASIALIEGSKLRFVGSTREDQAARGNVVVPLGAGIPGKVAQDGIGRRIECGDYVSPVTRINAPPTHALEHRSLACVPLKVRDEIIGTLQVYNRVGAPKFDETDLEALQVLADHSSVTVERLRLQKNLLIESSRVRGIFQALTDGIMVVDMAGNPVLYNQAVESLFFPDGKQNYALATYVSNVIRSGETSGSSEVVLLKPHEMILSNRFVTIPGTSGNPAEVIVSIRNISDQRAIDRRFSQFYALMLHKHAKLIRRAWKQKDPVQSRKLLRRQKESMRHLISLTELKSGPLRLERGNCSLTDIYTKVKVRFERGLQRLGIVVEDSGLLSHGQIAGRFDTSRMILMFKTLFIQGKRVLQKGETIIWNAVPSTDRIELFIGLHGAGVSEHIREDALDWNAQVDRIISGESATLDLDLAFLGHMVHAHKGTITICRDSDDETSIKVALPLR